MELRKIEELIEKYEAGETSLAEEKSLREYFSSHKVPAHLETYRFLFGYVKHAQSQQMPERKVVKSRRWDYVWTSVAASVILVMGLFLYQNKSFHASNQDLGTITDQELALQKTKETLRLVSEYMNEGTEDLVYLKEFNKTKNKFISDK